MKKIDSIVLRHVSRARAFFALAARILDRK